ncbi:MAG: DNA primase [Clostridia bacterium]|nr:DNA primase [Clostridia bacterium]
MANSGFSTEWKEELKSRSDIVSTVSKYMKLDRKGKNYWGLCPFHYEKTPSFCINEVDQFYKCFGCGESGDVITFVKKFEGVDFMGAVEILAKNAGMEMPKLENNQDLIKQKKEKEQVLQALRQAAIYYNKTLKSPDGKVCLDYLKNRGVSDSSITKFGMGYSKDFESMKNHLLKQGFSEDILKKAGLIDIGSNGKTYDSFAQRLTFPLINSYGEVIGFSARIIEDKPFAKYKNSAQTMVFDKSRVVFGINLIKKLRNELHSNLPRIILVEGQLDVVSMHQAGFNNTVACLGTALTPLHAKELKKMTDNIILLLDGDGAGQKATMRSIDILKPNGLSVKVAVLPDKLDPDEFLKKYSKEDMASLLDNAIEAVDYQLQTIAKNYDLTSNEQKANYIKSALNLIRSLETDAEKNIYLENVRKLTNIPVDVLRQDLNSVNKEPKSQINEKEQQEAIKNFEKDAFIVADKFILASLLYRKPWANLSDCEEISFILPDANTLFDYIKSSSPEKPALVSGVFDRIDVENSPFIQNVINCTFNEETAKKVWIDCINKNKQRKLLMLKDKLEQQLPQSDIDKRKEIAKKLFEIDIKLAKLKSKTNN